MSSNSHKGYVYKSEKTPQIIQDVLRAEGKSPSRQAGQNGWRVFMRRTSGTCLGGVDDTSHLSTRTGKPISV